MRYQVISLAIAEYPRDSYMGAWRYPMARTPTPKRKAPAKPAGKQAVLLRLPRELVAEIDAIAAADRRPRSMMMEIILADAVQTYRQRTAA
jgi:hypothetical protein